MRARLIIIDRVRGQHAPQMPFANDQEDQHEPQAATRYDELRLRAIAAQREALHRLRGHFHGWCGKAVGNGEMMLCPTDACTGIGFLSGHLRKRRPFHRGVRTISGFPYFGWASQERTSSNWNGKREASASVAIRMCEHSTQTKRSDPAMWVSGMPWAAQSCKC
jgi:hypothetical protein